MQRFLCALGLALALSAGMVLLPRTQGQQPADKKPAETRILHDVEYAQPADKAQKLDLYLPQMANGPRPVLVLVHGGGWSGGDKELDALGCLYFVRQGYVVANINYRLSGAAKFPAQIEDCKSAVRWLRANAKTYNLDPDRFGAFGFSAGGHLVALLGTAGDVKELDKGGHLDKSSRVQAVCDVAGPTDPFQLDPEKHKPCLGPVTFVLGGAPAEKKALATLFNPITHVTKDDPPFLILHGDADGTVPVGQAQILHDALKKAGVDSTLTITPKGGHGVGIGYQRAALEFFDRHLKGKGK